MDSLLPCLAPSIIFPFCPPPNDLSLIYRNLSSLSQPCWPPLYETPLRQVRQHSFGFLIYFLVLLSRHFLLLCVPIVLCTTLIHFFFLPQGPGVLHLVVASLLVTKNLEDFNMDIAIASTEVSQCLIKIKIVPTVYPSHYFWEGQQKLPVPLTFCIRLLF